VGGLRLVLTADTHCQVSKATHPWPDGDVLVVAGDLTWMGTVKEIVGEIEYLKSLHYPKTLVVAGNHDFLFEDDPMIARLIVEERGLIYLEDQPTSIEGVSFFGSPWSPTFGRWAFMRDRGRALKDRWAYIPDGTDVLITHGPPAGIGDVTQEGVHAGDIDLLQEVAGRIKPKLHVFGHIHEGYGWYPVGETIYVNASLCDRQYRPWQAPFVFDIEAQHPKAAV
jgi:Icc-related predicted phosphoesterase